MTKLLFILLFLFGCDEINKILYPEDCAGVQDGEAYIDDCNQCVGGTTVYPHNYLMDECGICGGDGSSCNDTGDGGDDGGTDGGYVYESNVVITNTDYNINNPYGYAQLIIQISNIGSYPSFDYEYLIQPCIAWKYQTGGIVDYDFEHNFYPALYLPGLDIGESLTLVTENENLATALSNGSATWTLLGECSDIY